MTIKQKPQENVMRIRSVDDSFKRECLIKLDYIKQELLYYIDNDDVKKNYIPVLEYCERLIEKE